MQEDPTVWCLVPLRYEAELCGPLDAFFAADYSVHVIVDYRRRERRRHGIRRSKVSVDMGREERRTVRSLDGWRVGDQRAETVRVDSMQLPEFAMSAGGEVVFVRRVAPLGATTEDLEAARLIIAYQAGDRGAFEEFYRRYYAVVLARARRLLGDVHEAEDAAQEVFIRALGAIDRFEVGAGSVRGWLLQVVRNVAIDRIRKRDRVEVEDAHAIRQRLRARAAPEEGPGDREFLVRIDSLPDAQQQVLALRFAIGLPTGAIAESLGRSPASVRQLQHRGLAALRATAH